jgi:hypothetical protein
MSPKNASPHLLWSELECHTKPNPTPYPGDWRKDRLPRLCAAFEAVRAIYGKRLDVDSAYRTVAYNASPAVKGAANSQHCQGLALDVKPPEGIPVKVFWRAVYELAQARPDLGIHYVKGYAGGWVHFDLRPSDRPGVIVEWED